MDYITSDVRFIQLQKQNKTKEETNHHSLNNPLKHSLSPSFPQKGEK